MHVQKRTRLPFLLLLSIALVACGGSESSPESSSTQNASSTEQTSSSADVDRTVTLQPKGNQMKYKQTEFTVTPGETVKLVFQNVATSPSMQHNVVLVESNDDDLLQTIGQEGTKAGSRNDYIPQDSENQATIIAHTSIAEPGETVEVTFTVPDEPGEYGYVCTYPGHWATMQGTMYVEREAAE